MLLTFFLPPSSVADGEKVTAAGREESRQNSEDRD